MKNLNPDLWLKNLELIHRQAMGAKSSKDFFIAIAEYLDFIGNNPDLLGLARILDEQRQVDQGALEDITQSTSKFCDKALKALEKLKIDDTTVLGLLEEAIQIKKGGLRVHGDDDGIESINQKLNVIAHARIDPKIYEVIDPVLGVTRDKTGQVIDCLPDEFIRKRILEKKALARIEAIRAWHSWGKLTLFNLTYRFGEQRSEEEYQKRNIVDSMKWSDYDDEINSIFAGKDKENSEFLWEPYRSHFERVHRFFLNEIQTFSQASNTDIPEQKEIYGKRTYTVIQTADYISINVEGKKVNLKKSAKKTELFKHLLKKPEIFYSEIVDELDGDMGSTFDPKKRYYELCRGLQLSFSKHGILNFIIFDYNKASVNKLYKRMKV